MSFTWPLALLGLVLIPLLILLDRWRRRPRARVWPSLQLWRAVEGLDAPSKRRVQPLLLYECAAVLLLALAAAGPVVSGAEETEIIVLVDVGPHMQARLKDGRTALEATLAEVEKIPGNKRHIDVDRDLVAAATSFDEHVILATNRPDVEGKGYTVVGRAVDGHNVGIDVVEVKGDRLWFALATDGPPREVDVQVGDRRVTVRTGIPVEGEFSGGTTIRILDLDNYGHDNECKLSRPRLKVICETDSPFLKHALRVGVPILGLKDRSRFEPDLVIVTTGGEPTGYVVHGTDCVASPGIFDGLVLDGCHWGDARSREGDGLLSYKGRALVAWDDERTLWLGLPVHFDWDEHATLAIFIDRVKRTRVKLPLVGDATCDPAPGFVDTRGVDRPWNGPMPTGRKTTTDESSLAWILAALAVAVLALYARAMLRA